MTEQPERWSQATTYPDMWVDPDDDPRNSDGAVGEQAVVDAAYADLLRECVDGRVGQ
jgi:hypothetical protein